MTEVKTWLSEFLETQEVKDLFEKNYLAQQQLILVLDNAEFMIAVASPNLDKSKPLPWKFDYREGFLESIGVNLYSRYLYFLDDLNKLLQNYLQGSCI